VAVNLVAIAAAWLLMLIVVQVTQRLGARWFVVDACVVLATLVALGLAWRFRAHGAVLLIGAAGVFEVAEFVIHAVYGIRGAQGAPVHFAVMGAAFLGVAVGALLLKRVIVATPRDF
jgi:hypothetical protein